MRSNNFSAGMRSKFENSLHVFGIEHASETELKQKSYEITFPLVSFSVMMLSFSIQTFKMIKQAKLMLRTTDLSLDLGSNALQLATVASYRHDCVSNYHRLECLLNRLFRRWSKKTSKLRVTDLCEGNSSVTGDRWFSLTEGQWRVKCFHLMTPSRHPHRHGVESHLNSCTKKVIPSKTCFKVFQHLNYIEQLLKPWLLKMLSNCIKLLINVIWWVLVV